MTAALPSPARRRRLLAECLALYLAAPVAVAVLLPPSAIGPALLSAVVLGLALLALTPGFRWGELARGWGRIAWGRVAGLAGLAFSAGAAAVALLEPSALLQPGLSSPWLLAAIALLYPPLSALPQEAIFRPLFFRRYAPVLPEGRSALLLNAGAFSLAHLCFWSIPTLVLTFAGGLAFAHAHRDRGSFPEAVALHAAAGTALFAAGAGTWLYSGGVARPF